MKTSQLKIAQMIMADGLKHHFDDELRSAVEHNGPAFGALHFDGLYRIEQDLDDLLDKSQNPPPDGKSDGTIDADRWRILKHAHDAIRALRCNLDQWERLEDSR